MCAKSHHGCKHSKQEVISGLAMTILALPLFCSAHLAVAQNQAAYGSRTETPDALVIGFTGGFVHSDAVRHSEVQLAQQLQAMYGDRVRVQMFENRHRDQAHQFIVHWLNSLESAGVGSKEPPEPRIILFGHSWGASTTVYLARDLEKDGIPVALTIQVDSIRKGGEDDSVIPVNVHDAVNFYQTNGLLHGRSRIRALDPKYTTILGNYRYNYQTEPTECRRYPKRDRLFFKGHTAIECDPRVWYEVLSLIQIQLAPTETRVADYVADQHSDHPVAPGSTP